MENSSEKKKRGRPKSYHGEWASLSSGAWDGLTKRSKYEKLFACDMQGVLDNLPAVDAALIMGVPVYPPSDGNYPVGWWGFAIEAGRYLHQTGIKSDGIMEDSSLNNFIREILELRRNHSLGKVREILKRARLGGFKLSGHERLLSSLKVAYNRFRERHEIETQETVKALREFSNWILEKEDYE